MTQQNYSPSDIEPKWQKQWEKAKVFDVDRVEGQKKYYLLEMLPYPSGRIHMGHVRNYTIGDVAARYHMMNGFKVLHPIGWDAFGMPAENAAIKHGTHPAKWTYENIEYMKGQLKRLGLSYDWRREFATCDPKYYKWEQLIFTKMFEKGWAYKKTSEINWCPSCETVLANEQAEGGVCWRCDSAVVRKSMSQWFFKITDYAEELLNDIDVKLKGWPERVKTMQKEWIGKSEGAFIEFQIEGRTEKLKIFTTRPDTVFGVTFMSLAGEHPLVDSLVKGTKYEADVNAFRERTSKIDRESRLANEFEKEGVFTGSYCINPLTNDRIPVYCANFVLMEYGTGAVMAVPGHDQRDFEFAAKYKLPVKLVIKSEGGNLSPESMQCAWEGEGELVNSGQFDGMKNTDAIRAIAAHLEKIKSGGTAVTYRLKDWCLSRQRYWGAPIPIVYCDKCGMVAVPEKDLPVILPQDVKFTGEGGSPLLKLESFVHTKCPKCTGMATRETDTMDTFVESSWYMLRYTCPWHDSAPVDRTMVDYWLPVDQYIGGIEHAVGHLIYCRYFTKVMRDLGMIGIDEPVKNLMTQGMVYKDGAKMSKSKGNVVDPDDMIAKYGADTARMFMLFAAPPEKDVEWSDQGVEGSYRFILRVWRLAGSWMEQGAKAKTASSELSRVMHKTIKRVTEDIERYHFNTAIAALMEYVNYMYGMNLAEIPSQAIETLIVLISPFVPHVAQELWQAMGQDSLLINEKWPAFDKGLIESDIVTIVIQVNGKLRDKIEIKAGLSEDEIKELAVASEKVVSALSGRAPKKVIVIPGKLVNIVG